MISLRVLVVLGLLLPLPVAAGPMETNQLVDGSSTPIGTDTNPFVTRNPTGGAVPTVAPQGSSAAGVGITPQTTTGTALVAKATAGNLYGYSVTMGATAGYLAFLNATIAPAASAAIAPLECVPVAANSYVRARQDIPDRYGIGIVAVSTSSCMTYTAVTPQLIEALVQ